VDGSRLNAMRVLAPYLAAIVSAFVANRIGADAGWGAMSTYLLTAAIGFPLGIPVMVWAGWLDPPAYGADKAPPHVG
jgi:CO dehydrogenase/acetyl-CoA synthase alpha subunit